MLSRIRKSLKAKLSILFFALNMSAILLVGIISYDSAREALLAQLENNLTVLSRQTAETVDRFMAERQSDTKAIALHYALFNLKTTTSSQNEVLGRYLKIYPYYEQINIINIEDMRIPDEGGEWYLPAVKGETASSDMYISPITELPTMSFAAPIKDESDRVVSIITTNLKLEYLWDIVDKVGEENAREGQSGYAFMLDSQGMIIAHPDRGKVLRESLAGNPDKRLADVVKSMTRGGSGTSSYNYEGIEKYVAYTPCTGFGVHSGNGWSVGVTSPTAELLAPLKRLVRKYMVIFLGTSLLVLLISTQFVTYLARPILALKRGAAKVGGGDFSQRIVVKTRDEIGELAGSFNEMAETLQARDEQIKEYTSTLTTINEELKAKQEEIVQSNIVLSRTNEELRKLEQQKAEFLAMLTHDIKSPLSTIITYAEMIMGGMIAEGSDGMMKAVGGMHSGAHKILSLIDNFLVSSTIEAGKLNLHLKDLDLNEFVDEGLQYLVPRMEKKKITLTVTKAGVLPHVLADKVHLDRVFTNIVSNAIKYTQTGGKITVTTGRNEGRVFFSVSDTGTGISAEELKSLFDIFKRTEDAKKVKGFGLGLYISKAIIDKHGGEITVDSTPGVGSTFTVLIPARGDD